jgi:phage terminase small subunit
MVRVFSTIARGDRSVGNRRHKPAEQLQGRGSRYRGSQSIALLPADARRVVPRCPRGLTEGAKAWYGAFCKDPISQLVTLSAWPKVQRLAVLLSRRETIEEELYREKTVTGSMGQRTINPLIGLLKELNREIEKIEGGLGLLPQDRMRLGIALGQAQQATAEGLRRGLDAASGGRRVFGSPEKPAINLDELQ